MEGGFPESKVQTTCSFSKMKYDETPLRMKVQEFNECIGSTERGHDPGLTEDYIFTKIFRIEWTLSFMVRDLNDSYHLISLKIPPPMAAVQRNTAESLDLSKAFDTVNWETLWEALRRQNTSNQLIWIFQCLYHNQTGVVRDGAGDSRTFDIFSGVRQGCVLSPRLFCAALELAMSEWRLANPHGGVDLGDAMPRLLDLRFADDILIFANTKEEVHRLCV